MQVVLMQDVAGLGKKGQTKNVAEGYAKNFLFPRNLAIIVTKGSLKQIELQKQSWERREVVEREAATKLGKKIDTLTLKIAKKAGENGKLFGSVTTQELADMLSREVSLEIDKRNIMADHIKELGKHDVTVKLHHEVKATFKLIVEPEAEAAAAN